MTEPETNDVSSITLPENHRFLRAVPGEKENDEAFAAAYDRNTLFYDVFYEPSTHQVHMIGPALRNLSRYFKNAVLEVDNAPVLEREVLRRSARTSEVVFRSPVDDPKSLRLYQRRWPGFEATVPINRSNLAKFRGKNALVAISKNNKLSWISDWLTYYVRRHGANAVVLIDNGSDAYSVDDIRSTISGVAGVEAAQVISAPFPFGPKAIDRVSTNSKFFHLSMLHVAHRRYLADANAVLSVDIDELVVGDDSRSVFEVVKTTPAGFLSIPGTWRYARKPADGEEVAHVDHVLQRIGKDAGMQPKWCIDPKGHLKGQYWRVHGVVGAERYHQHSFQFLHCRQITTSWDYARDFEDESHFIEAEDAQKMQIVFASAS